MKASAELSKFNLADARVHLFPAYRRCRRCSSRAGVATGLIIIVSLMCPPAESFAQCTILVQDTFRLGLRPHDGGGQMRETVLHETLSGFWPLFPPNVQWTTLNVSGQPTWAWAATSTDPMEVDALDVSNGTAYVATSHVAALLPFTAPAGSVPFTLSAEAVLGVGQPDPVFLGFTSSNAVTDNFMAHGSLWMSLDGLGNWAVYANGTATLLASGNAGYGQLGSGWTHMLLRFDPGSLSVSGSIGASSFGPLAVSPPGALSFVGFEAHDGFFNVVNNFLVHSGTEVTATISGTAAACSGANAAFTATTNAAAPMTVAWALDGNLLVDGPFGTGSISGATTTALTITGVSAAAAGTFQCVISNACASVYSNPVSLNVFDGASGDGNGSGTVDGLDIPGFITAFVQGGAASASYCAFDMNGNGVVDFSDVSLFVDLLLSF